VIVSEHLMIEARGERVLVMTDIPRECCECHVMRCFFVNRDGHTCCCECDWQRSNNGKRN
jgi:hypothetical protein